MNEFVLIEGDNLSKMCDYTFGDQASVICNIPNGFMKMANLHNKEFLEKINEVSKTKNFMTLFIDNIRLYKRKIVAKNESDQKWIDYLMDNNDLLKLCSQISNMNFIIFTNLEDTPIDSLIQSVIPNNVIKIHAVNSVFNSQKVIPSPYGIQRKIYPSDNRDEILLKMMGIEVTPRKLVYLNHNVTTNFSERLGIYELFTDYQWASIETDRLEYPNFLNKIKLHKFVVCPIGNGVDCHRNWEVLYMRRVPIMKRHEYLEKLFDDFPVLFVDEWSDITENLLSENDFLFSQAQKMSLDKLNLKNFYKNKIQESLNDFN